MSDEKSIRESNFIRVCKRRQLGATELAQLIKDEEGKPTSRSLWYDLLARRKASFGEKLARRIEDALELPRGFLDQPPSDDAEALAGDEEAEVLALYRRIGPDVARAEARAFLRGLGVGSAGMPKSTGKGHQVLAVEKARLERNLTTVVGRLLGRKLSAAEASDLEQAITVSIPLESIADQASPARRRPARVVQSK